LRGNCLFKVKHCIAPHGESHFELAGNRTVAYYPARGIGSFYAPAGNLFPKGGGKLDTLSLIGSIASIIGLLLSVYFELRKKEK
jgi:hypothetical protein